jgi:hypothetical protein
MYVVVSGRRTLQRAVEDTYLTSYAGSAILNTRSCYMDGEFLMFRP